MNTREYLAFQRTIMANERTLLAYIRTSLAFFIVGCSLIKFFNLTITFILGLLFIFLSILILLIGFLRYKIFKSKMKNALHNS
ncbi:MAG: DUF202 domain-containing protein [candidate division WOR-3 bacterium]|uniref:DUF202 domain-containing protein n=1 Tax=candidate division WOR-3 bacterium TaxID=2052148 RepID=A0A7V4E1B7_UNCW3